MRINLLSHDNGVGLTQDVKIVKQILDTRYKCTFIDLRYGQPQPADVNIFFEILDSRFYKSAKYNLLFPNPEWFMWPTLLKGIDLVLCKTRDAVRIFNILNAKTVFTSFTSEDRAKTYNPVNERVYLHTAGQSRTKGTDTVFRSWKREYPEMIFTKLFEAKQYENHLPNIYTYFDRIPLDIMIELQNKAVFHLCTSEYEGFGHYIWEAKSARGIVITTDAPPMSEMVWDGVDGFLVTATRSKRMNYGRLAMVDLEALRACIEKTMLLTNSEIKSMRRASRESWEANDVFFKEQLFKVIGGLK
jgi:glycosyltransferase involved in cell wall biosynthesis